MHLKTGIKTCWCSQNQTPAPITHFVQITSLHWPRELNTAAIGKHTWTDNTKNIRKHLHRYDDMCAANTHKFENFPWELTGIYGNKPEIYKIEGWLQLGKIFGSIIVAKTTRFNADTLEYLSITCTQQHTAYCRAGGKWHFTQHSCFCCSMTELIVQYKN